MRRSFIIIVFIVVSMVAKAQQLITTPYRPVYTDGRPSLRVQMELDFLSGSLYETAGKTYNAVVFYESSTGHKNTYRLPVVVKNGSVSKIRFRNGGSVHSGVNYSGYRYYGGDLEYVKEIDAYTTEVTIVYPHSWQKYTIILE